MTQTPKYGGFISNAFQSKSGTHCTVLLTVILDTIRQALEMYRSRPSTDARSRGQGNSAKNHSEALLNRGGMPSAKSRNLKA